MKIIHRPAGLLLLMPFLLMVFCARVTGRIFSSLVSLAVPPKRKIT